MQKIRKKKNHSTTHINQEDRESKSIHRNTRRIYEEDRELTYMQKKIESEKPRESANSLSKSATPKYKTQNETLTRFALR